MPLPNNILTKDNLTDIITKNKYLFYYSSKNINLRPFENINKIKQKFPSLCMFHEDFYKNKLYTHDLTELNFNKDSLLVTYQNINDTKLLLTLEDDKINFFTIYDEQFFIFSNKEEAKLYYGYNNKKQLH